MRVPHQKAGSCISSITCIRHGTLVNMSKTDAEEKKLLNKALTLLGPI